MFGLALAFEVRLFLAFPTLTLTLILSTPRAAPVAVGVGDRLVHARVEAAARAVDLRVAFYPRGLYATILLLGLRALLRLGLASACPLKPLELQAPLELQVPLELRAVADGAKTAAERLGYLETNISRFGLSV